VDFVGCFDRAPRCRVESWTGAPARAPPVFPACRLCVSTRVHPMQLERLQRTAWQRRHFAVRAVSSRDVGARPAGRASTENTDSGPSHPRLTTLAAVGAPVVSVLAAVPVHRQFAALPCRSKACERGRMTFSPSGGTHRAIVLRCENRSLRCSSSRLASATLCVRASISNSTSVFVRPSAVLAGGWRHATMRSCVALMSRCGSISGGGSILASGPRESLPSARIA